MKKCHFTLDIAYFFFYITYKELEGSALLHDSLARRLLCDQFAIAFVVIFMASFSHGRSLASIRKNAFTVGVRERK